MNFKASKRAKFNALSYSPSDSIGNFVLHLQTQAVRCNDGFELDNELRDRFAGISDAALQKKMLLEKRSTFTSLRTLCEKFEEFGKAKEQPAVFRVHKCRNERNQYKQFQKSKAYGH